MPTHRAANNPFFQRRTHCRQGHPLAGDNVLEKRETDGRISRLCRCCFLSRRRVYLRRYRVLTHWRSKGDSMDLDYFERNVDYVVTMEEAIGRLTAAGHFLTTQSLYAFVGESVAGSRAKVAEFLKARGDAPQADAFWDLRGCIGEWMTQHGLHHEIHKVVLYLTRITAEMCLMRDESVLSRMHQMDAAQHHILHEDEE